VEHLTGASVIGPRGESGTDFAVNEVEVVKMKTDRVVTSTCETTIVVVPSNPVDKVSNVPIHEARLSRLLAETTTTT
jgi:hypothetical protein